MTFRSGSKTNTAHPLSPSTSVTENVDISATDKEDNTAEQTEEKAPSLQIQASTSSQKTSPEILMMQSISPMKEESSTRFPATDDLKSGDEEEESEGDDELYAITPVVDSPNNAASDPAAAFQAKSLELPAEPVDISKDASFEAMYEAADNVVTDEVKSTTSASASAEDLPEDLVEPMLLKGRDGDSDRDEIRERLAKQEEFKAQMKRKQSKTTAFDTKPQSAQKWGKKTNSFPTEKGQQKIVEWRFLLADNEPHIVVLQHEVIKKQKKSKRMVIFDGKEKYSDKSKKTEWQIKDGKDVLEVTINNVDVNEMKYEYKLKINGMPYTACFFKWQQLQKQQQQ